jgi:hypothetical protein
LARGRSRPGQGAFADAHAFLLGNSGQNVDYRIAEHASAVEVLFAVALEDYAEGRHHLYL